MHDSVKRFLSRTLAGRIEGKDVLEVGSYNVNGSVRDVAMPLKPSRFVGVDIRPQPRFVDEVLDACGLLERFGPESWDVVVSAEMLEHAEDWEGAVANMRDVLKPGGLLVLTARGPGFPLHAYPNDHWRFTTDDVAAMFSDFSTLYLCDDPQDPGFHYAGIKPGGEALKASPAPMVVLPHTKEWHDERIASRLAAPVIPHPFACFYHVACMGNWREVVAEQVAQLSRYGTKPKTHVLGTEEEAAWVESQGCDVIGRDERLDRYELPTLLAAWEWAKANPGGAVLYLHTKGVSAPDDPNKTAWRELMMSALVGDLPHNLELIARFDIVGVDWQNSRDYPHFSGNFWLARCDWLSHLISPAAYQASRGGEICSQPWERMFAEMWLGSRPWHSLKSLVCSDRNLWRGPEVFGILEEHRIEQANRQTLERLIRGKADGGKSVFMFDCGFPSWARIAREVGTLSGIDPDPLAIELSRAVIHGFRGEVVRDPDSWLSINAEVVVLCGVLERCCNGAATQTLLNVSRSQAWQTLIVTSSRRDGGNGNRGRVRGRRVSFDVESAERHEGINLGTLSERIPGADGVEFLVYRREG